ncbi:right-handed parallel beta-helix repeat-containing protein [Amycolatopsis sp. PS_44_ISF1]|uniref:right-handed parallel beta-helix repeat-containing protein n=1 Tax=Amycolatopsis sp. PS_44_ISF1 TaxID=2974917 RepID=UPI0028DEECC0|nr:right-handed parallel beta-helix repeat-containing protein [Amycolatopsis sp. PS_44_ISF1]MDT8915949.1 right-handed parallel beta-helix repeat-containing protein [Amycolatopsis sp. PS_44_ISF1]
MSKNEILSACAGLVLLLPFAGAAAAAPAGSAAGAHAGTGPACTRHLADPADAGSVRPGDVVCFGATAKTKRLKITKGGTAQAPVTYSGAGQRVGGIDVDADHVIVDGYTMDEPSAPGIEVHGNGVTVRNNTVTAPKGGDGDGLRFFGDDITISHNTISRTDNSTGAHADCMQTFATDEDDVASSHLVVDGNRCEQVDNMCLMAEGPDSEAGDGSGEGVSEDWTFSNNYCQTREASQTLMVDDVQHLTVTGNTWAAGPDHAVGLQNHSTDAHVGDNALDPSIECEVGIDKSSKKGYEGPTPRCDP